MNKRLQEHYKNRVDARKITKRGHSIMTSFAVSSFWFSYFAFQMHSHPMVPYPYEGMKTFWRIFGIALLIIASFMTIVALYEWGFFIFLRREGLNQDKNWFFEESAGKFRKGAFYIALLIITLFFSMGSVRILGSQIITSIVFFIALIAVLLEKSRIFTRWSNKTHFKMFVYISLAFIVIVLI